MHGLIDTCKAIRRERREILKRAREARRAGRNEEALRFLDQLTGDDPEVPGPANRN
jgi:hypothetical protein